MVPGNAPLKTSLTAVAFFCLINVGNTASAFDCSKAYLGVDFVICPERRLMDSADELGRVWGRMRETIPAERFGALLEDQRRWVRTYGPECGLPPTGRPNPWDIVLAVPCVSARIDERLSLLKGMVSEPGVAAEAVPSPPPTNPSDVAATVPACGAAEVRAMVERAVFKDLGVLGVPVVDSARRELMAEIARLAPDVSARSREGRRVMATTMRIPVQIILVCGSDTEAIGIHAVVIQNPDWPHQWGVMVMNYGVPYRAAVENLEFIEKR